MRGKGLVQSRLGVSALLALWIFAMVWSFGSDDPRLVTLSGVICIFGVSLILWIYMRRIIRARTARKRMKMMIPLVANDIVPSFLADSHGHVHHTNVMGRAVGHDDATEISELISSSIANPNALLFRLQNKADENTFASESVETRRGTVQLGVQRMGDDTYLWRMIMPTGDGRSSDQGALPMLTVGPSGTILFMNESFRAVVGERSKRIERVFKDLPLVSGRLHEVKGAERNVRSMVATRTLSGGREEVYLLPGAESVPRLNITENWSAFEELPVPMLLVAATGEVVARNREASKLLGQKITDGSRLSDLLEGLGRPIIDWLAEVAAGRGSGARQFLRGTGEDRDFFVQVALAPAGDPDARYVIATLNDMTEFKSLEAQFVQSQKMQAIGQLAGGVAHDFNNLLTAISGHCDLLLLKHDQADSEYGDLIQIHQNANRAASLVGQLLAFSRKQNLNFEVIDLRDTLSDLTYLLNRLVGERVKLVLDHDPDLAPIRVDKRQLEQVIMNLVVNARDAMPSGGEIRVETENIVLEKPIRRDRALVPADAYVLVKVIDEGVGIAPEKIGKIFEPFYTTKRTGEGTGLGLSTVYGIVKQTGGFIFAESEPNVGTVFSIYLPAYQATDFVADEPKVETVPERVGPRETDGVVLLVEDEAPVRAFASRALKLRGYTVLEADCAENALEILANPGLHVDLFVTDVIMPGKDGPTWVREALLNRPDTKVVFVSGYAEDAFGENRARIPNSVFLPKPFSLNDLTQTVQEQMA